MQRFQTSQTKIISLFMALLMLALPFLSMTPALAHSMLHNNLQQTSQQHAINNNENVTQPTMHDCCDKAKHSITKDCCKNCAHGEQCQCDSVQIGYTLPIRISAVMAAPISNIEFQRSTSPALRAQLSDSLYRPPIAFL